MRYLHWLIFLSIIINIIGCGAPLLPIQPDSRPDHSPDITITQVDTTVDTTPPDQYISLLDQPLTDLECNS